MKKTIKTMVSLVLTVMLTLSLASCSIFEAMRENALNAQNFIPEKTPEENEIINEFNKYLENSKANALTIKENISYSAGGVEIYKTEEEKAGTLDAAANQLKNFIMSANPGSAEYWVKGAPAEGEYEEKAMADSLLSILDESFILDFDFSRNMTAEAETDADGKEVKDEDGNTVMIEKEGDNVLHITFNYYDSTNLDGEEYATNENGEPAEETTFVYSDTATIESIFGSPLESEAVLKNFENISDYIKVNGYEIEYTNCRINADADLGTDILSYVNFQKEMNVTAKAECVGALESYGEVEIKLSLTQTINYEFTYETTEDGSIVTSDVADVTETETAEASSEEETSLDAETSLDEETSLDAETSLDEETSLSENETTDEALTEA